MSHRAIQKTVRVETSEAFPIYIIGKHASFLGRLCEYLPVQPLYFFIESVRKSMLKSANWRVCICQSNRSDSPQRVSIRPLSLYRMATMMNEINYLTYAVKSIPWWLCGFLHLPPGSGTASGTDGAAASLGGIAVFWKKSQSPKYLNGSESGGRQEGRELKETPCHEGFKYAKEN